MKIIPLYRAKKLLVPSALIPLGAGWSGN